MVRPQADDFLHRVVMIAELGGLEEVYTEVLGGQSQLAHLREKEELHFDQMRQALEPSSPVIRLTNRLSTEMPARARERGVALGPLSPNDHE